MSPTVRPLTDDELVTTRRAAALAGPDDPAALTCGPRAELLDYSRSG